jgi:hypothetical protein
MTKVRLLLSPICNAMCYYCHNEGQVGSNGFMSMEVVRTTIEEMEGISEVVLSGGEPTLHPEVVSIARYLSSRSIYTSIVTNGRLPRVIDELLPLVDEVKIHVDSLDPFLYKNSMGVPIEPVLTTLSLLSKSSLSTLWLSAPLLSKKQWLPLITGTSYNLKLLPLVGNNNGGAEVTKVISHLSKEHELVEENSLGSNWLSKNGRSIRVRRCEGPAIYVDPDGNKRGF